MLAFKSDSTLSLLIRDYQPDWAYQIAAIYAYRGAVDKAFEWLERAYQDRDPGFLWIKVDPLFQGIKNDPRYAQLVEKTDLAILE